MMGQIVSFYSYKGGVGRSMAVANLAVLLAQRGERVLVVDFDLDAPGLHRYFIRDDTPFGEDRHAPHRGQLGVIELFGELRTRVLEENALHPQTAPLPPETLGLLASSLASTDRYRYLVRVADPSTSQPAALEVLTAGRFDASYPDQVHTFPWRSFYEEHGEAFSALANEWRRRYDWILVDSRTGITDIGGVSTVLLPDKLVLVFAPNRQSLNGVLEVGRQVVTLRKDLGEGAPVQLFPLLSRVDEGEEVERRRWIADAARSFAGLFADLYPQTEIDFARYFDAIAVPHRSYFAYGERIAVEEQTPAAIGSLAEGYARFLDCLLAADLTVWQERSRIQPRQQDCALLVNFDAPIVLPPGLAIKEIAVSAAQDSQLATRLRALPVDVDAWTQAAAEIDRGIATVLRECQGGAAHLFVQAPYPAAALVGRRFDDVGRASPLYLYQQDSKGEWVLFSVPAVRQRSPEPQPYYEAPQVFEGISGGRGVVLVIEGTRPIGDRPLRALAEQVAAGAILRLRPRQPEPLGSLAQAGGALKALDRALTWTSAEGPGGPIHIVATAPVALLVELGRRLRPTVFANAVVYQYDPRADGYTAVLDLMARRPLAAP